MFNNTTKIKVRKVNQPLVDIVKAEPPEQHIDDNHLNHPIFK